MKYLILLVTCVLLATASTAQQSAPDSTHSVRSATVRSALVPGWGQIYNKKYWKAPIVWAGIGTCVYFIDDNLKSVKLYRSSLAAETDNDPATVNSTGFTSSQLSNFLDTYTRWRDLAFMSCGIVYLLNIVDAHVDAHLFHFDVDENLSFQWQPALLIGARAPGLSMRLQF